MLTDAFPATDGTGVTRAVCMSEREKGTHFRQASGSGQTNRGQWRQNLMSLIRMVGSTLWIFRGL